MKCWWAWKDGVERGDYTQDVVEDFTGCIPLFLKKCIVKCEKDKKEKIMLEKNLFFETVYDQVKTFEKTLQGKLQGTQDLSRYIYYNHSTHITSLTSLDTINI